MSQLTEFEAIHRMILILNQKAANLELAADELAKLQPLAKWARQNPQLTPDPEAEQETQEEEETE